MIQDENSIKNYPILKDVWGLTISDMLIYLLFYPEHDMDIILDNPDILISEHKYQDHLHIRVYWEINNISQIPSNVSSLNLSKLLSMQHSNVIACINYKCLSYSQNCINPPEHISKLFSFILKTSDNTRIINKEKYLQYEFALSEPTKIADFFYTDLLSTIDRYIEFEKYYQNLHA